MRRRDIVGGIYQVGLIYPLGSTPDDYWHFNIAPGLVYIEAEWHLMNKLERINPGYLKARITENWIDRIDRVFEEAW